MWDFHFDTKKSHLRNPSTLKPPVFYVTFAFSRGSTGVWSCVIFPIPLMSLCMFLTLKNCYSFKNEVEANVFVGGKLVARYFCWKCMQAGKRWSVLVKQLHAASRACLSSTVCSRNYCQGRQRAASGTHADMAAKLKILYISTHQKQTWNLKIYPQTEKEKDLPKTATFQFHDCFRVYLLCVKKCSFNCRYILLKKCWYIESKYPSNTRASW